MKKTKYTTRSGKPSQPERGYSEREALEEFGVRLQRYTLAKGWNQSALAERTGLGRDSISKYIRGQTTPEPHNLIKLAKALDVSPGDLFPGVLCARIEDVEKPVLEMKQDAKDPTKAWLRVNQKMPLEQAGECLASIMAILKNKPTK